MRIVVEDGPQAWVQELGALRRATVGRALSNTIVIEDAAASREHCAFVVEDDGAAAVEDLGSRNGTRLNGELVTRAALAPGDRVEIGQAVLTWAGTGDDGARRAATLEREAQARREWLRAVGGADALARDPLTGLLGTPAVVLELRRLLAELEQAAGPAPGAAPEPAPGAVAVVRVDLDHLGLLNDMFGLRAGDGVILHAAGALRRAAGEADVVLGREAGGRFLAVFGVDAGANDGAAAGLERARAVAEALRAAVGADPLPGDLGGAQLTASAGLALAPRHARSWDGLLRRAEGALAAAKRGGRARVAVAPDQEAPLTLRAGPADARASGLWAASGLWDPRRGRAPAGLDGLPPATPAPGPGGAPPAQATLAPLALDPPGQRILALVAQAIGSDLELDALLDLCLAVLVDAAGARRGYLVLRDESGALRLRAALDRDLPGVPVDPASLSQGVVARVAREGAALLVEDAQADPGLREQASVVAQGVRALVAAPLALGASAPGAGAPAPGVAPDDVVGVVVCEHRGAPGAFGPAARDLLLAFGRLVAGPIRRQALHEARGHALERARAALHATQEAEALRRARYAGILGDSAPMQRLFRLLDRVAETSHPVLIQGESGTGKELVARALHANGPRRHGPFVAESCAALQESVLEAELFGHVRGAFTGATGDRVGLIEAAHGGTLFLDEVGDMPPGMQAKLLRVLQEGEVRPVGGNEVRRVDARVIAATHRDLRARVAEGLFREDLYYRLAVMTVDLPPLRERVGDVPALLRHFVERAARADGRAPPEVDREALELLVHHTWPGNVRELENTVRAVVAVAGERVLPQHLPPRLREARDARGGGLGGAGGVGAEVALRALEEGERALADVTDELERAAITRTLARTGGNRSETARRLGLSRPGLLKKMKRFGIS